MISSRLRTVLFVLRSVILVCASLLVLSPQTYAQDLPLAIDRVIPEGDNVPVGRQIVIQFNRPVVPIGRMQRDPSEIPVVIEPNLPCEWRWLNTSALSCNLTEKNELVPATTYKLTVKTGIKAHDGATMAEPFVHQFTTQRPDVRYAWFFKWISPTKPMIRVTLNQSSTISSVRDHLFFTTEDGSERVAITVEKDPNDRETPLFIRLPGTKGYGVLQGERQKSDDDERKVEGEAARRVWIISPERDLPPDATLALKIEPGLRSAYGEQLGDATREIVRFATFPEFRFVGVKCFPLTNSENPISLLPGEAQSKDLCDPQRGAALQFSAPVRGSMIRDQILFDPPLKLEAEDPWREQWESDEVIEPHEKGRSYDVWLPEGLKAASTLRIRTKPLALSFTDTIARYAGSLVREQPLTDLRDRFDRPLLQPIEMSVATDHRKPNFEIVHRDAVIEKQIDSEVPLYVNNLTSTTFHYRRVTKEGVLDGQVHRQTIPAVQDVQFAVPFKIREMLGGRSGVVLGGLETTPPVVKFNRLFAEVTPYQVQIKLGHFNSLVWVTDLATGEPVYGARVAINRGTIINLTPPQSKALSEGVTDADGVALLAGTDLLDPLLSTNRAWSDGDERLMVWVEKGEEMALLPISYEFLIDPYRSVGESVGYSNLVQHGHLKSWGTTAQGVYRAGDTMQFKIYVRAQDVRVLRPPPLSGYSLQILDPTGAKVHEIKDLSLNEFGAYSGEYTVPKQAPVGWYQFQLVAHFAPSGYDSQEEGEEPSAANGKLTFFPMKVLVSDFTPAPFRVSTQLSGDTVRPDTPIEVQSSATLHSGGVYGDAAVRVTALLRSTPFQPTAGEGAQFHFGSFEGRDAVQVHQSEGRVDARGEYRSEFSITNQPVYYGQLQVESAIQDDRGKNVSSSTTATYVGVDRFVGLRSTQWSFEADKEGAISWIVVDEKGEVVPGVASTISIERSEVKGSRVKGAGNAYLTQYHQKWVPATSCDGISTTQPTECRFTARDAGSYRAVAKVRDTKGREHTTTLGFYVVGRSYVMWEQSDDSGLEIVPEKRSYRVGERARYLVKNPFPGAKALVTIERYGVLDHFIQTLESSTATVEFEVKQDYLPGFYLSVVVFSPRVEKPIEKQVDLGKPAFRIGYVTVPVRDQTKEIAVTATVDREVYKPRERVSLRLQAKPRVTERREKIEFAVAVLDEAVFDLISSGRKNFDPYEGFYSLDGLDLRNYSLLMRLIGRQNFEKKGANPGGDGGAALAMRNLFSFVSYWNPSIVADAEGRAEVEFEVPDNLTGWRVLALAVTPSDRMGLGEVSFKVNRPTEIRPVMPNQVGERDTFQAGFSVMNRTDTTRQLTVRIAASGDIESAVERDLALSETVTLEPYKRTTVWMPVRSTGLKPSRDLTNGAIRFTATASDALDRDGVEHTVTVHKLRSLETAANYGSTSEGAAQETILFPKEMQSDVGSVSVVVSPSIVGNVEGAFRYLRDYPYQCWEQVLTKGVMASYFKNLQGYLSPQFTWKEASNLPEQTIAAARNFQAPNGGMTYFGAQDAYVDPYLSAYTAIAFSWLRGSGYSLQEDVESKLLIYLEGLLRRDVFPTFYDEGMTSTVRAVALAALAARGRATVGDLDRFAPSLKLMSLFGKSFFLQAAHSVAQGERFVAPALKEILAHSNSSGGKFTFSEVLDDSYSRILSSPLRENCSILTALTSVAGTDAGKQLVGDIPEKLMRTITQARGSRDYWENTQENMFCMNALTDYSRVYEKVKPSMTVRALAAGREFGQTNFRSLRDTSVSFERPIEAGDPGSELKVSIERKGEGRLYYSTQLQYAPTEGAEGAVNAGIELRREYSVERDGEFQVLTSPMQISQSDLVRVDLFVSIPTARNFVVVEDPVPGGLEPVNRDLATASTVDATKGEFKRWGGSYWFKFTDWITFGASRWSFYHQELRHNAVRFYSDYLPAGNYHLSYTAQAIAPGEFVILPVHAEEMYNPDVFGRGVLEKLVVHKHAQQ